MSANETSRPCGLYRTTVAIGDHVPVGALVYYHNHGDPGPGVYLPREWRLNRAVFQESGTTIPDAGYPATLEPLPAEGLYRVAEAFDCCEQRCQRFEEELIVQLGYNGQAAPILFVPELVDGALAFPTSGMIVDERQLRRLLPLKVRRATPPGAGTPLAARHGAN